MDVAYLVRGLSKEKRFKLAILLSGTFCLLEAIAGTFANSLAVLSDASHLLTDVAGFAIALVATIASRVPASNSFTYGLKHAELLGAIFSIGSLYMITLYLVLEAISRSMLWYQGKMDKVDGKLVFFISVFGVFVNLILGLVFHDEHGGAFHPAHSHDHSHESGGCSSSGDHDHNHNHIPLSGRYSPISDKSEHCSGHGHDHGAHHDHGHSHGHSVDIASDDHDYLHHRSYQGSLIAAVSSQSSSQSHSDVNIEAAYAHVLSDLIQSAGVAMGGLLIWIFPTWQIIDPVCTLIFSLLVVLSTVPLSKKIGLLVLHAADNAKYEELKRRILEIKGVAGLHDLHLWNIGASSIGFTAHIAYDSRTVTPDALHQMHLAVNHICRDVGVDHSTVQMFDCSNGKVCPSLQCKPMSDVHLGYQSCA